jgi:hypothetical protein
MFHFYIYVSFLHLCFIFTFIFHFRNDCIVIGNHCVLFILGLRLVLRLVLGLVLFFFFRWWQGLRGSQDRGSVFKKGEMRAPLVGVDLSMHSAQVRYWQNVASNAPKIGAIVNYLDILDHLILCIWICYFMFGLICCVLIICGWVDIGSNGRRHWRKTVSQAAELCTHLPRQK